MLTRFTLWRVGLGSNARSMHRTITSNRAVVHPDYFEDLPNNIRLNDLGIIELLNNLEPSANIFPIQFVQSSVQDLTNIQGMIVGFAGATTIGNEGQENKQAAHVRVIPDDACLQMFPRGDSALMFCAMDNTQRSNFCLGDQVRETKIFLRVGNFYFFSNRVVH
jgi:Trypsin